MKSDPEMTHEPGVRAADVALLDQGSGPDVLTYAVPQELQDTVVIGSPVQVTVARRSMMGYVIALRTLQEDDPLIERLVVLAKAPDDAVCLTESDLDLARWMADRWMCHLGHAIGALRPPAQTPAVRRTLRLTEAGSAIDSPIAGRMNASCRELIRLLQKHGGQIGLSSAKTVLKDRLGRAVKALSDAGLIVSEEAYRGAAVQPRIAAGVRRVMGEQTAVLTPIQSKAMAALPVDGGIMPIADVCREAGVSRSVLDGLIRRGVLVRSDVTIDRNPLTSQRIEDAAPNLTPEQSEALRIIRAESDRRPDQRRPVLVHGVTASGKTEIYLEVIRQTRSAGRSAIVLVPEIALAAQVVDVITRRYGADVAVLHSRLGAGERHDSWQRVADGRCRIVVGARSAVFAPVRNLGLIVIDEEHEAAYKQEVEPRYHAREVAEEIARRANAVVVLGSATPSLETFHRALTGGLRHVRLAGRATGIQPPTVEIVDMRAVFRTAPSLFSEPLLGAIRERLEAREQVVLFLNRRGFARFVLCRDCGFTPQCPNCAVALVLHTTVGDLRCHHCGYSEAARPDCPECKGTRLRAFGVGTEKLESQIAELLPEARLLRMDRDTTSRKGAHTRIIRAVRAGEADILLGTQMVAKGLDFPRVTLVGVISADVGLHVPDFRAAERSYQILTQVAGRAGRSQLPGRVIIQTFTPEHYAVQSAARQDYDAFYAKESAMRAELGYPPYATLINVLAADENPEAAEEAAAAFADAFRAIASDDCRILGPCPAPLVRLHGRYRWHSVIRSPQGPTARLHVRAAMGSLSRTVRERLTVDVDPVNMA